MDDNTRVNSSFSATINAPIELIDLPTWCFSLPEAEYQACSPAHCSAGVTTAPDGRRIVHQRRSTWGKSDGPAYVEEVGKPDHKLIIIGLIAHTCVEATVLCAAELGFEITVVKDATPDYSEEVMHAALEINLPNYANGIVTTSEVLELISFL